MALAQRVFVCLLVPALLLPMGGAFAQVQVLTERNDLGRTGANLGETQLDTSNVNAASFGKLWSYPVSGSVQAQPLYVAGVNIPGVGVRNVIYIVTMNDVVYAFDADSSGATPLWSVNLTRQVAGSTPVPITDLVGAGLNIVGNVGIESTPQIDLAKGTLFLVARTKEGSSYPQRLHALDLASGAEKSGSPVVLSGSVPGSGNASVGGTLTFDPRIHNQRSSLALANGKIFMGWASHEDANPYHGWVMAYDEVTLQQTGIWCSSPDGIQAGVWMAGRGPAVDASGNVYFTVGNGDWNGSRNFGESLVKFAAAAGIPVLDWFTPDNWSALNGGDVDFGSSGPMLLPGTDLLVAGGKESRFYLMHQGSLGHLQTGNTQIVQTFSNNGGEFKGGPIYWNRAGGAGPWMYVWSNGGDILKAYHFNGTTFDTSAISQGTIRSPNGASGGVLSLSANGSTAGTGIVWSSMPLADDADHGVHQGILRAIDASDLTRELWNSRQNAARDDMGNWPKFSPPTVVNGKVYLASFPGDGVGSTAVNVYGLLPSTPDFTLAASPASATTRPGSSASYTVTSGSRFGFAGNVTLSASGLPSGSSASFSLSAIPTPGSATLTLSTSATTPTGSYQLTIGGVSGSLSHATTVQLQVSNVRPGAGVVSVDFVGRNVAMAASEVAGVVPRPGWNAAQGASGSGFALSDETGTSSGATLSWNSSPVWSLPVADQAGDVRMMVGYLDTVGANTTLTVAGLPVNSTGYDLLVYADGDNGAASRTGTYQLSGNGITTTSIDLTDAANANFSGVYTKASSSTGNYVAFSFNATGFTLTAIPGAASDATARAPVNGFQIVPHPGASTANPTFSPPGGSYSQPVSVTLSDATAGAAIFYTTDGTTPTTASTRYTGPILISSTAAIKAIATSAGSTQSAIVAQGYTIALSPIPQTNWKLKFVDSQELVSANNPATNSFDGNTGTFWHTQWASANPPPPHELQINLGATYSIKGFGYLPRQDGCNHGDIKQYELYVSSDGVNWGAPVSAGTFSYAASYAYGCGGSSVTSMRFLSFPAVTGSYVRLRALSEMGGNAWTSAAELNVLQ